MQKTVELISEWTRCQVRGVLTQPNTGAVHVTGLYATVQEAYAAAREWAKRNGYEIGTF